MTREPMELQEKIELAKKSLHNMIDNQIPWNDLDDKSFRFSHEDKSFRQRDYLGEVVVKGKKHGKITIEW